MTDAEALVFVVDDDASLRASLQDLLESGFVKLLTILPSP
jgi:FixJ family two-component response regulator